MQFQNSLGWKTTHDGLKQYLIREVPHEQHQKIERFVSRLQTCRHKLIAVPKLIHSSNGQVLLQERRESKSLEDFLASDPPTKTKLYLLRQLSHALENLHTFVGLAHGSLHQNCISISEEGELLLGGITYNTGNLQSDRQELHNLIAIVLSKDSEKEIRKSLGGLAPFRIRNKINKLLQNESWENVVSDWKDSLRNSSPSELKTRQETSSSENPEQPLNLEEAFARNNINLQPVDSSENDSFDDIDSIEQEIKVQLSNDTIIDQDNIKPLPPEEALSIQNKSLWQTTEDMMRVWETDPDSLSEMQKQTKSIGRLSQTNRIRKLYKNSSSRNKESSISPEGTAVNRSRLQPPEEVLSEADILRAETLRENIQGAKTLDPENLYIDTEDIIEDIENINPKHTLDHLFQTEEQISGNVLISSGHSSPQDNVFKPDSNVDSLPSSLLKQSPANDSLLDPPEDNIEAFSETFSALPEEHSSEFESMELDSAEPESIEDWAISGKQSLSSSSRPIPLSSSEKIELESEDESSSSFLLWASIATIVGGIALLNYFPDSDASDEIEDMTPSEDLEKAGQHSEIIKPARKIKNSIHLAPRSSSESTKVESQPQIAQKKLEEANLESKPAPKLTQSKPKNLVTTPSIAKTLSAKKTVSPKKKSSSKIVSPPKRAKNTFIAQPPKTSVQKSKETTDLTKRLNPKEALPVIEKTTQEPTSQEPTSQQPLLSSEKNSPPQLDLRSLSKKATKGALSSKEITDLYDVEQTHPDFTKVQAILLSQAQLQKDVGLINNTLKKIFLIEDNQSNPIFLLAQAHHSFNQKDLNAAEKSLAQAEKNWSKLSAEQMPLLEYQKGMLIAHFTYVHFLQTGSENSRVQAITQFKSVGGKAKQMGSMNQHKLSLERVLFLKAKRMPTRTMK